MGKYDVFACLLIEVLTFAEKEKKAILNGEISQWELYQIQKVIIPEMSELLFYAQKGEIYFKYGKKQRLLESTYLITDSFACLSQTQLGKSIIKLQEKYYGL